MPETTYRPPFFLFNAHLETIFPALTRHIHLNPSETRRIATPDNDFLELDIYRSPGQHVLIISHGLEGNSRRGYVLGMVRSALQQNFNVIAWNYRGCGPTMNLNRRMYHSGATDDLATVIKFAQNQFNKIYLTGFSLGGNLTLKYLGETSTTAISGAVAISVPLHLSSSCDQISQPANRIYEARFLKALRKKVLLKARQFPDIDLQPLKTIRKLREFDDHYTAPLHGFQHAAAYYQQCSALYFLAGIQSPTLILNAWNDPFLSPACFPAAHELGSGPVSLESPAYGGHVGFTTLGKNGVYWSEWRTMEFFRSLPHD